MGGRLRVVLGVALTALVFGLLVRRLSLAEVAATLRTAKPAWLAMLVALAALGELLRAVKWGLVLGTIRRVGVLRLYGAIMIGYLANIVVPLRVSPLVRAYVVRAKEGIPTSTVLATVAVDRLADGLVSVGLIAAVLVWLPLPAALGDVRTALTRAGWVLLAGYLAVIVLLALVTRAPHGGGRVWIALGRPLSRRRRAGLVRAGRHFVRGLVLPRGWGGRLGLVGLALAQKATQVWQIEVAARAFGVHVAPDAALFLVIFLGAVVLVAGALGIRGGYLAAAAVGLGWFGVAEATGLAMGLAMDAASYVAVVVSGLAALWAEGLSAGELRRWRGPPAEAGPGARPQGFAGSGPGPPTGSDRAL